MPTGSCLMIGEQEERQKPKTWGDGAYLCHLFSVCFGVQGSLCQQHRVFFRGYSQLIVEGMVPDLFHVIPVGDNAVFNGVLQGQDASFTLRLISNVAVFLAHANHHTLKKEEGKSQGQTYPNVTEQLKKNGSLDGRQISKAKSAFKLLVDKLIVKSKGLEQWGGTSSP